MLIRTSRTQALLAMAILAQLTERRGATRTGTLDISDLLAAENVSVAEFGLDRVQAVLQADLDAHNRIVDDMIALLAERTTDRQRRYGPAAGGEMTEVDEYGRGPTQKSKGGDTVGFPLRKFQFAIGWTTDWFLLHTPADMARQQIAAQKADVQRILLEIKKALFGPTNYTFTDFFEDNVDLAVKRLVNADGASIPTSPYGVDFDGATHTHYDAIAAVTNAAAKALALDVLEHHDGQEVRIAINVADEDAWRALTEFKPYVDARLTSNANANEPQRRLDFARANNRAIGIIGPAEVWVKPWAITNYAFAWVPGAPKPLAMRERKQAALRGLRIAAQLDTHPLHAQYMERYFGFGVWNRTNGAILRTNNAAYAEPTW